MEKFIRLSDVNNPNVLLDQARKYQREPLADIELGKLKTLVMLFSNPSLRTRLSTQLAAENLGMKVVSMDMAQGWGLETQIGVRMDQNQAEHLIEAAGVISSYADIIGIRSFATLKDRKFDYEDQLINQFANYSSKPLISLESAIRHPLQSLADILTIQSLGIKKPKIVVTWAPHPRPLPQAVTNSFLEWSQLMDTEIVITHPPGMELAQEFSQYGRVVYDQDMAFKNADFIYTKNWSSYENYGSMLKEMDHWMVSADKMAKTNQAKFMHCLPVRRNVVVADEVLDSANSIVQLQAKNRIFAAQAVLSQMLK